MRWMLSINTLLSQKEKITGMALLDLEQKIKYCGCEKIRDNQYSIGVISQEQNEMKLGSDFYLYFNSNDLAEQILNINFKKIHLTKLSSFLDQSFLVEYLI